MSEQPQQATEPQAPQEFEVQCNNCGFTVVVTEELCGCSACNAPDVNGWG